MIDFSLFECGITDWIMDCLCLDQNQVFWKYQNQPQPHYPYIALLKTSAIQVGQSEERLVPQTEGEPKIFSVGLWDIILEIEALVGDEHGGQDPNKNAFALLTKLLSTTSHSKALDYFCDANATFIEEQSSVLDITSTVNDKYVSRATVDLKFRAVCYSQDENENLGFIESVRLNSNCDSLRPIDITITGDKEI